MLSQDLIREFQQVVMEDYGKDVGLVEASQILTDLVGYFDKLAEINHRKLVDENVIIKAN